MTTHIRHMRLEEVGAVRDLWDRMCADERGNRVLSDASLRSIERCLERIVAHPDAMTLVAESEGRPVGFTNGEITRSATMGGLCGEIAEVYADPEVWDEVAPRLVAEMSLRLVGRGADVLKARVGAADSAGERRSRDVFALLGWDQDEVVYSMYPYPDGDCADDPEPGLPSFEQARCLRAGDAVEPPTTLEGLGPELLDRVVRRIRAAEPRAVAVLVGGSYATGRAAVSSDLDVTVVVADGSIDSAWTWFEERPGRPLHISAGTAWPLKEWNRKQHEESRWSLWFPTDEAHVYLWATDEARAVLGERPTIRLRGVAPSIEDLVEQAVKVKRALRAGDAMGARFLAKDMVGYGAPILVALNQERRVRDPRQALDALLSLEVAPAHHREDVHDCLGLGAVDQYGFARSALRWPLEVLELARERRPDLDPQPGASEALGDGTFERHLRRA